MRSERHFCLEILSTANLQFICWRCLFASCDWYPLFSLLCSPEIRVNDPDCSWRDFSGARNVGGMLKNDVQDFPSPCHGGASLVEQRVWLRKLIPTLPRIRILDGWQGPVTSSDSYCFYVSDVLPGIGIAASCFRCRRQRNL